MSSPPTLTLEEHLDDVEFVAWRGQRIDVWHLYDTLTACGWKVDTEESNQMVAMSRTWRSEGIKVWLHLEEFVCAPPSGEVAALDRITFHRFDPAAMPAGTMYDQIYSPGDETEDWYPSHREEWDWLVENGDPQTDTFDLLTPIPLRAVPAPLLAEAWRDIGRAVKLADSGM